MRAVGWLGVAGGLLSLATWSGPGCSSGNGRLAASGGTVGGGGAIGSGGGVGSGGAIGSGGTVTTGGTTGSGGALSSGGTIGSGGAPGAAAGHAGSTGGVAGSTGGIAGSTGGAGGAACVSAAAPGPTWTQLPSPPADVNGMGVTDAWPAGQDDFFFVGSTPSGWAVLRWTNGCWTVELNQSAPVQQMPRVSGTSPSDVWVTTGDAIFHRDAQGWTQQGDAWRAAIQPNPFTTAPSLLTDAKPLNANEVWFTSQYAVLRLLDGQWQSWELTSGSPNQPGSGYYTFHTLWVSAPNDVWAAGGAQVIGSTITPASAYHWDGASWTIFHVGNFDAFAIWPAGGTDQFWVAVDTGVQPNPLALLDGTANPNAAATSISIGGWPAGRRIVSLWGRSSADVWGAGEDIAQSADGATWTEVSGTPGAVTDLSSPAASDSIVTGDATATWLVGRGPTFYRQAATAH